MTQRYWEDLVECPGCGMAVPKAGECGNPDCPHYTGKKRAVYSPPLIESSRSLGLGGVTPFRCCASPEEAEIVLEGFSRPVTASWGTYRGEESIRLVACRRCGVVLARPAIAELVPEDSRKCSECERIVVLPMDHGPSCSQNPESKCEVCRKFIRVPTDHRLNCPNHPRTWAAASEEPVRLVPQGEVDREAFRQGLAAAEEAAAKERSAEEVNADVAQIAFTQAGDQAAALEAIRELLLGTRIDKNRHTGALIFGQCSETDSGGARCELPQGHEGQHACPKAVERHRAVVQREFFALAQKTGDPSLGLPETVAPAEEAPPEPTALDDLYAGVSVYDGKYTFYMVRGDHRVHCKRNGEDWFVFEKGGRAVLAVVMELCEAREKLAELSVDAARGVEEYTTWLNSEGRGGRED